MSGSITVGELRQNPTRMLREVKAGARYTITDHGEPIAEVAAITQKRWVPAEQVNELLSELGADDSWAHDIQAARTAEDAGDPWQGA
ncbi:type II toxin-antitoxin system Phd/YefM family antitoxin [Microbacterium sp.]|uniref:type II toxin-antitoxin system Phd/YefM family antitoxin n=1 Tax=Microbacterium sp. TaxID=51671 RepID=UPI0039E43153